MRTKTLKISKTMAAAALFMLLTAVKLFLPGPAEAICAGVRRTVNRNFDYEQAIETLGASISDGRLIQALGLSGGAGDEEARVPVSAATYRPVTVGELRGALTAVLPEDTVHAEAAAPAPESEAEETGAVPAAVPEAVAAFLASQTAYADYEMPANVSCDLAALPFDYVSPVPDYTSSGFGFRWHPIDGEVKFHYGTDFAAWSGDDIYAFAAGTVSVVGYDQGYGDYIVIDHADGWSTLYAHCGVVYVTGGQKVALGEKIALVGATGEVTGPHLHFELRCNGVYYNPEYYTA